MRVGAFWVVILLSCAAPLEQRVDHRKDAIVGGRLVPTCGYPYVVGVGQSCTGTLIHPYVVVTAASCGEDITYIELGEELGEGIKRRAQCVRVPADPSVVGTPAQADDEGAADLQFCILDRRLDAPLAPAAYGCEAESVVSGAPVVSVGFGQDGDEAAHTFGRKRGVATTLRRVDRQTAQLASESACEGDTGGAALVQMDDGTFRVLGLFGAPSEDSPCHRSLTLIHPHISWFEEEMGLDITPCHDADGTWNPSDECGGFSKANDSVHGDWSDMCAQTPRGGRSATCGAPIAEAPDAGLPVDAGTMRVSLVDAGAEEVEEQVSNRELVGVCSAAGQPPTSSWMLLLALWLSGRRGSARLRERTCSRSPQQ